MTFHEAVVTDDTKFNEILVDRLNFKSNQNNVVQQIESYSFYLENIYYDFQFWHPENEDEEYKKYKEQILTSISFEPNLTIKNQFTKN